MLTDSYQPVYDGLGHDAMAKVGAFAASFMQADAHGDEEGMHALVKQAMESLVDDDEAVDRLFGTLSYAQKYGSPMEKIAVERLLPLIERSMREINAEHLLRKTADWRQNVGLAASIGGLALGAAPYVAHARRQSARQGRIKQSLQEVMRDHPELRSNPHTARYFQAIVDFAPDVAANSLVAGNVMKAMHQIGPSAVSPKMISELLQVQRSHEDRPTGAQYLGEYAKQVGSAGKAFGGK